MSSDPQIERYGGMALRTVLRLEIDSEGVVTSVSTDEASGAEALDNYALHALAVGPSLPPPPDCGRNAKALHFTMGLCLVVPRSHAEKAR